MNIPWPNVFISICTLITIAYHSLLPNVAFAKTELEDSFIFPYDKGLEAEYKYLLKKQELEERLKKEARIRYHTLTAYSSTVWQTDANPFITAAGTKVRDGIVAANTLPFGTKIMIPDMFGEKIFTVEDRMAPKNHHKIDIWFPNISQARKFGVKRAKILIIPASIADALANPSA